MADGKIGQRNQARLAEIYDDRQYVRIWDGSSLEAHYPEEVLARPFERRNQMDTRFFRYLMILGGVFLYVVVMVVTRDVYEWEGNRSSPQQPTTNSADETEMATMFTVRQRGGEPLVLDKIEAPGKDGWSHRVSIHEDYRGVPRMVQGALHGAVAADRGICSEIGVEIMRNKGGNAADAAISTALCEGVLSPSTTGLGGGAFILVRYPNGTAVSLDGRERAPAAASGDMFDGHELLSTMGPKSIALPTELKALDRLRTIAGSLDWADLVEPVLSFAREGFRVSPYVQHAIASHLPQLQYWPQLGRTVLVEQEDGSYRVPKVGELCCKRPQLAALLEKIGKRGAEALYNQETAAALAAEIKSVGGVITADDIMNVEVLESTPYVAKVQGHGIMTMGLPSSGPLMLFALQLLELYDWSGVDEGLEAHRLIEVMRQMFALRLHLGDVLSPGAEEDANIIAEVQNVMQQLRNESFVAELKNDLLDDHTLNPKAYGGPFSLDGATPDDSGTAHISVVDRDGLAVSMTSTINGNWGSFVISPSTGLLLNNEMADFSVAEFPNIWGIPPSQANYIQPRKAPISSMAPTIVTKDDELRLVLGASGGPGILTSQLLVLYKVLFQGDNIASAVQATRVHDTLADATMVEEAQWQGYRMTVPEEVKMALESRGHELESLSPSFCVQIVAAQLQGNGRLLSAVSDLRKDGAPAGY